MIKKILVAIDGSGHSDKALTFACDLAGKYDSELHLLHVVEIMTDAQIMVLGSAAVTIEPTYKQIKEAGQKVLDAAQKTAEQQGCKSVTTQVESGPPAKHILEYAKDKQIDVIVMGSRGLSDFAGLLMGSVSHKVSHLAECTCVSVR